MNDMPSTPVSRKTNSDLFRIDFPVLLATLKRKLFMIIVLSALAAIAAGAAAKLSIKDTWEARCILILHPKNMSQQQEMPYLYQQLDPLTAMEIIKLRRNLEDIIETLKLPMTPEQLFGRIRVEKARNSDAIHLLVKDQDPRMAVRIANTLAETFIRSFVPVQNSSASRLHQYYVNQREKVLAELQEAGKENEAFQSERKVLSLQSETTLKFDALKALEIQLLTTRTELKNIQAKIDNNKKSIASLPDRVVLTQAVKTSLDKQIKDAETELQGLRRRYPDENPKVGKLVGDIAEMKKKRQAQGSAATVPDEETIGKNAVKESLQTENFRLDSERKGALESIKNLDLQIAALNKQIQTLNQVEREYYEISRRLDFYRELLKTVETRIIEAKIAMESNISDFEVLEPAAVPSFPTGLKRRYLAAAAGIVVFLLLIGATTAKEILDPTVKSADDLKETVGIPVAGIIPDRDEAGEAAYFAAFQVLFRSLSRFSAGSGPIVFAMASDTEGSGKSFLITEALRFFAADGHKTLWIESIGADPARRDGPFINAQLYDGVEAPSAVAAAPRSAHIYFQIDDSWLRRPLRVDRLRAFLDGWKDRDIVFWELPPLGLNIQYAADIVALSDVLFLIAGFRISRTQALKSAAAFLGRKTKTPIEGILTQVDPRYWPQSF